MNSMSLKLLRCCNSHTVLSKFTWSNNKTHSLIRRFLFTPESFRIDYFKDSIENFTKIKDVDVFKGTMDEKCKGGVEYLIFVEELKNMLMICKTDDDLELLFRMVKKYSTQRNIIRFGSVSVGPQIMRLLYVLNKPEKGLDLVKDPETSQILCEITSWLILGDLLFKNEMYEEVVNLFYLIEKKQLKVKYPSSMVNLFFAACYKLNSRKNYEEATKMFEIFKQIGFRTPARSKFFYAALALKQKEPNKVLDILDDTWTSSVAKNLKVLALLEIKEFPKIFALLNDVLENTGQADSKLFITKDTLERLEKVLQGTDEENFKIFQKIKENLDSNNLVSTKLLEDYLLQPIEFGQNLKTKK